jgi:hypothetical protein
MLWQEFEVACFIIKPRRFSIEPEEGNEEIVKITE